MRNSIAVVGAGSWGTTFAIRMANIFGPGQKIILYEHFKPVAQKIARERENKLFLPGFKLPRSISISNDLPAAVAESEFVFNAVPTQFIRGVYQPLARGAGNPWKRKILVNLSKGIEIQSGKIISQVFHDLFPNLEKNQYAALSGPSHAEEVIIGIPTAAVVAGTAGTTRRIQRQVSDRRFRLYTNDDVTGVELAGALKNCIAVSAGICVGLGFGDNTLAAIMTRGLAEISRLGVALGAKRETFAGLAGLGDLVVTCGSRHSRNRRFGEFLAKGMTPAAISKKYRFVAEGVATSKAAVRIARNAKIEIPIIHEVYRIIYSGKSVRRAVDSLLTRPFISERI